jgi:rhodanese-related sulfurtransferase
VISQPINWERFRARSIDLLSAQNNFGAAMNEISSVPTISRTELLERLDRACDFVLVEILSSTAYDQARLPGAINLPLDRLAELAATLLPDKTIEIVIYGAGPKCVYAQNAARELSALGYPNVLDYAGGKQDWFEAGLRIEVINNSREPRKAWA